MTLERIIRYWYIIVLITLNSCNGPFQNNTTQNPTSEGSSTVSHTPTEMSEEIVYFSYDNGLSWENASAGLTSTTHIGLGGIATSGQKVALLSKDKGLYFFNIQEKRWNNIPTYGPLIESNPGALLFFKDYIYAGTQFGGVFRTEDEGKTWTTLNTGLDNLTIRKFAEIENKLYAATNEGLYSLNETVSRWEMEYGNSTMQVNGITALDGGIYIATNQGAFTSPIDPKVWKKIFTNGALHNINSDENTLYAMVYNELYASSDQGKSWQSIQKGLPANLYTFDVIKIGSTLLAAQWDGVYRKTARGDWQYSGKGLADDLAISNLLKFNEILVAAGSERRLKAGMTLEK